MVKLDALQGPHSGRKDPLAVWGFETSSAAR